MTTQVTVPHSAVAVDNLVAIELEHVSCEKFPELSCGCGCDMDDEEMAGWTEDDFSIVCQKSIGDPDLCMNGASEESKESGKLENYSGEVLYPCPTLLNARANASTETLVAVALILGGVNR